MNEYNVSESRCWDKAAEVSTLENLDIYPARAPKCYQIFNSSLTKDDKKRLDTNAAERHPTSSIEQILESARKAKSVSDKQRGTFQQKAETILAVFHKYAICFDVMIQQSPEVTSIVWGSVRFLMGVRPLATARHLCIHPDATEVRSRSEK